MKKKHVTLPINKMEFETIEDSSLSKVKIYVMHDKDNLNNSFFEEEAIEKAKDNIKNKPIVCAIEKDEDDTVKDFKGHEVEYKVVNKDGKTEIKEVYIEQPVGVIPESNNYRIEEKDGLNWVVVDGLIFNNYCKDTISLLNKKNKKVSMEIMVNDGEMNDEDGLYHIKDFEYLGITILGDDYKPAMGNNAEISLFSLSQNEKFTKIFQSMVEQANQITEKEGVSMSKKTFSKEETGEIYLYGAISSYDWWGDEITPSYIKNKLEELKDKKQINVYVNSPGGEVFAGNCIANLFKRCDAKINMFIDGLGASMGSVIPMAGDTVNMYSNSLLMIHNPWTFTYGNSNELRKTADDMDKLKDSLIGLYMEKAKEGVTKDQISELMNKETWLTASESAELFDINIIENDKMEFSVDKFSKGSVKLFNKFTNIPSDVLTKINNLNETETENIKEVEGTEVENIKEVEGTEVVEQSTDILNYKEEYKKMIDNFSTLENKNKELESKIEKLESSNSELSQFKLDKENEELRNKIDETISKFEFKDEQIKDVKEKAYNKEFSLEVLEEKLYALKGKMLEEKFSSILKPEEDSTLETKIFSKNEEDKCPYGSLSVYFKK